MGNQSSRNTDRRASILSVGSHGESGHVGTLYYQDGRISRRGSQDPTGYSAYGGPIGGYIKKSNVKDNATNPTTPSEIEITRV
uniref:Uncharacterized protein n=1 Tax=Acrobeloides nanus TaxID=290746 RepID=A0A914C4S0_9BILA